MKSGRKRIGQPISITLTERQRMWIAAQHEDGESRCETIRRIINEAMGLGEVQCEKTEKMILISDMDKHKKKCSFCASNFK